MSDPVENHRSNVAGPRAAGEGSPRERGEDSTPRVFLRWKNLNQRKQIIDIAAATRKGLRQGPHHCHAQLCSMPQPARPVNRPGLGHLVRRYTHHPTMRLPKRIYSPYLQGFMLHLTYKDSCFTLPTRIHSSRSSPALLVTNPAARRYPHQLPLRLPERTMVTSTLSRSIAQSQPFRGHGGWWSCRLYQTPSGSWQSPAETLRPRSETCPHTSRCHRRAPEPCPPHPLCLLCLARSCLHHTSSWRQSSPQSRQTWSVWRG